MEVDLPSDCANRPLHLIKFVKDHYRYMKIFADSRKQTYVTSGISSYNQKSDVANCRPDKFSRICFPAVVKYKKIHEFSWLQDITCMM